MFNNPPTSIPATTVSGMPPSPPKNTATTTQPKEQPNIMLTSFTTPVTTGQKNAPKSTSISTAQAPKPTTSAKDKTADQDKKGGFPQQVNQQPSPPKIGAGNDDPAAKSASNKLQQWDLQSLIQKIFSTNQFREHGTISSEQTKLLVHTFGILTVGGLDRQKSGKTDSQQFKDKLIKATDLTNQTDINAQNQAIANLTTASKHLTDNSYVSTEGSIKLLEYFVKTNRNQLNNKESRFYLNLRGPSNSPQTINFITKIVKECTFIKERIFLEYERFIAMLVQKKTSGHRGALLQNDTLKIIGVNLWENVMTILSTQEQLSNKSTIIKQQFSSQMNILLFCLNMALEIDCTFFEDKTCLQQILPNVDRIFELNPDINEHLVDQLVLGILLKGESGCILEKKGYFNQIRDLINSPFGNRYWYLRLLLEDSEDDVYDLGEPLEGIEKGIFIDRLVRKYPKSHQISPGLFSFIINSICSIFGKCPERLLNRHKFRSIKNQIENIIDILLEEEIMSQENDQLLLCVALCSVTKLIRVLCLSKSGISLPDLIHNDGQVVSALFRESLRLIEINPQDTMIMNDRLQQFGLTFEEIYHFLFKLITFDSGYFQNKKIIICEFYKNLDEFFLQLFSSHIQKFLENGEAFGIHLEAFAALVEDKNYVDVCEKIIEAFGSLKDQPVKLQDSQGRIIIKNEMEYSAKRIVTLENQGKSNLVSVGHLLLVILCNQPSLLQTAWIKALGKQISTLINTFHPSVLRSYAETLLHVLDYISFSKSTNLLEIYGHFDFRFIGHYLNCVLGINTDGENPKVYNNYMRGKRYQEVVLGVRLIREMSKLYLQHKEKNKEILPHELVKLMEVDNRNGNYQLNFGREACSYSLGLAVVLLSRQFSLDHNLKRQYPKFKDQIFCTLTNLNYVATLLHQDVSFRISCLYSRSDELSLNQAFSTSTLINQQIKWNPTFASLEFMITWPDSRNQYNKSLFEKVRYINNERTVDNLLERTHFIQIYWKQLSAKRVRVPLLEAWNYTESFLGLMNLDVLREQQNKQQGRTVMDSLFRLANLIRKKSLEKYSLFVRKYTHFYFQINLYCTNNVSPFDDQTREALLYFFNSKSILSAAQFEGVRLCLQNQQMKRNICELLKIMLENRESVVSKGNKSDGQVYLELVEAGLNILFELDGSDLTNDLEQMLRIIFKSLNSKTEITTRQIITLVLLHGQLGKPYPWAQLNFTNNHWLLLANVAELHHKLPELLLAELPVLYNQHSIYFVSFCHYILKVCRSRFLKNLIESQHVRVRQPFFQIMMTLLQKSIKEKSSYHAIWAIQIFSAVVNNQQQSIRNQNERYFNEVRKIILENQILHSRIGELLSKLASATNFKINDLRGAWRNTPINRERPTLSEKLQLLSYLRILTTIFFSPRNKHDAEDSLTKKEEQFFVSFLGMAPLMSSLLEPKNCQVIPSNQAEQLLASFKIDELPARREINLLDPRGINQSGLRELAHSQLHQLWNKTTSLDLLNEIIHYEFVSIGGLWLSQLMLHSQRGVQIHPKVLQMKDLQGLIELMDLTTHKLEKYRKVDKSAGCLLEHYQNSVYRSVALSKMMQFTNSSALDSSLQISYQEITEKLCYVVMGLYQSLRNVYLELRRSSIRTQSQHIFKQKVKNLKIIDVMLKNVDPGFILDDNRSTSGFESDQFRTVRTHISRR